MNLLVTGATGFVGRNFLLSALASKQYAKIVVPVRSREKLERNLRQDGYTSVPSELVVVESAAEGWDFSQLGALDHVVHCAGVIFARTREEYWQTNVEGTMRLLRTLPPTKKVVILSSQSASGPTPESRDNRVEGDTDAPLTWYGMSKLEMEQRVDREFPQLNTIFLRPPMIFGPRDHATLPLFKMTKRPFHFKPGWRSKRYSFIAVEDLVSAIEAVLAHNGNWREMSSRYFFVCAPGFITDRELITTAASVYGRKGFFIIVPQALLKLASRLVDTIPTWRATIPSLSVDRAKEIWPLSWVASSDAFTQSFGWRAQQSLAQTVQSTFEWYRRSGQI